MPNLTGAEQIAHWRAHPAQMVRDLFQVEPDLWQQDVLEAFPHKQRIALKACKGPGKTTVLAWLAWNFLLTRPHAQIAATSITGQNLERRIVERNVQVAAEVEACCRPRSSGPRRASRRRDKPETWFMSARSWSKSASATEQANALAGLHADYILFILDESGGIPAQRDGGSRGRSVVANRGAYPAGWQPDAPGGPAVSQASTTSRHLWHVVEITGDPDDPKRSPRVSIEWAKQQIQEYGRNNPWVLVNIFGEFPASSLNTLLGPDDIAAACKRSYREDDIVTSPRIVGRRRGAVW